MEVVSIASQLLLVAAIFQISDSIQVVVLGALRGLQDVNIPTLITFISYWIIGFPVSYFLRKRRCFRECWNLAWLISRIIFSVYFIISSL